MFLDTLSKTFPKRKGILDSLKELTQQMDDFVAWVRPEKISSTT